METTTIDLPPETPGQRHSVTVHRFGRSGARPKAYLHAALHADEIPAMLVAHHVRLELEALERAGRIVGEVVLVPVANPLGLAQRPLGNHIGRFDLADGVNFNRGFPDLSSEVVEHVAPRLTADAAKNGELVRQALTAAVEARQAVSETEHLKLLLVRLAVDADIVLDLHCDGEAVMHVYTLTSLAERGAVLGRLLGARALLVAEESGGDPFDEVASRPWSILAARFPGAPFPAPCFAATVELRGQSDVSDQAALADARALVDFLAHGGVVSGQGRAMPKPLCAPTPLAASEPIVAPVSGIVVYEAEVGADVVAGDVIATIVDPVTGKRTPVNASSSGVLYARIAARFVVAGRRIGKVAGTVLQRSGRLLSP